MALCGIWIVRPSNSAGEYFGNSISMNAGRVCSSDDRGAPLQSTSTVKYRLQSLAVSTLVAKCNFRTEIAVPTLVLPDDVLKHRFLSECLDDMLEQTLRAKPITYTTALRLDKKIRDFQLPAPLLPTDLSTEDKSQYPAAARLRAIIGLKESGKIQQAITEFSLTLRQRCCIYTGRSIFKPSVTLMETYLGPDGHCRLLPCTRAHQP